MNKTDLLSSFINGFGRTEVTDIINAAYVAKTIFSVEFSFNFQSRGSRGVDSNEIRRLVFFSSLKTKKNHKIVFRVAKRLSKVGSKDLAWLAQYSMNGETHLYKEESKRAQELQRDLSKRLHR